MDASFFKTRFFCVFHYQMNVLCVVTGIYNCYFSSSGMGNEEPISIPSMVKRNANEVPNAPALKTKDPETGKEVCVFI